MGEIQGRYSALSLLALASSSALRVRSRLVRSACAFSFSASRAWEM